MSVTEVSEAPSSPSEGPPPSTAPRPGPLGWLTSVDHKRLGVSYLVASLAFLVIGGSAALVLRAELASAGRDILAAGNARQAFTLHATTSVFLFLAPLWVGFATYVVPLQIGARSLALPSLHALAFWLFLGGGLIVVGSYLVRGGPIVAMALLDRDALGVEVGQASNLWLLGMGALSVAAVLAGASLIATVLARRMPGLTFLRLPTFTFATLVGSVVVVLATPVFVAGLVLAWVNANHGGGGLFEGTAGATLWQHVLWLYGRPELYGALLLPAVGAVSELVPVLARRSLAEYRRVLTALGAVGGLSFLAWAADYRSLDTVFLPTHSVPAALLYLPIFGIGLQWLRSLVTRRPRPCVALGFGICFLFALGIGALGTASAVVRDGISARSQWAGANVHLLLFASPLLAALAAFHYWGPKIWGRHLSEPLGWLSLLLVFGGTVLAFVPGYVLDDQPLLTGAYSNTEWEGWNLIATGGAAVLALGLMVFFVNLIGSVGAKRGKIATSDPWEGATLEWLAPSPPPVHNFDSGALPDIRSERPLHDLRVATDRTSSSPGAGLDSSPSPDLGDASREEGSTTVATTETDR